MNWESTIKGFKAYMQLERAMSTHSIDAYTRDVGKLVQYLEITQCQVTPQEVSSDQLEKFIWWLNDLGLSDKTQARILSGLKAFYKYMLLEDIIDDDPTQLLEGPRMQRKIPDVMSYDEIQAMLATIDLSHNHGVRNRAILETLYASGLRVSELTSLKLSGYFPEIGFLKIHGKNNKERIVPIGEEAIKHIDFYINGVRNHMKNIKKEGEDILFLNRFGKGLSRIMIFMIVKEAAQIAGIQKNVSPHTFRHSFATHLIEGGADLKAVQDMLGHESIITTEIYTHLDTDYLRETIMNFHPMNRR